ncbi:MAG: FAD-dependent monooxygenase [Candidatus Tritonobacter lacicola]|nr:FAD-dependent monooxygenase [Candidatus Tritonobacter lacicola]
MNDKLYEAIVVGGGPSGLSAGIELAKHGIRLRTTKGEYMAGFLVAADGPSSRLAIFLGLYRAYRKTARWNLVNLLHKSPCKNAS